MISRKPLISIITLNYNGKMWLKGYFDSLKNQIYKNFEIVFVDNGSKDGSVEFVKKYYPKAVLIENKVNLAIAEGNNIGVKKAKGDYILLLNNDIKVGKTYLKELLEGFEELPQASILQSKIVLMDKPEILDSCGSFWTDTGFIYHYGYQKAANRKQYNIAYPVFSGKSASMIVKREVIDRIGMYDNAYWGYYEETDHCHRAWIAGFETWYWPKAEVRHKFGGTTLTFDSDFLQFHNFKNKISSFLVNFSTGYLVYLVLVFLTLNVLTSIGWLFQGKVKNTASLYKAIWWNISNFGHILNKRKQVQSTRILSDWEIFRKCRWNPRISYYYHLFTTELGNYKDDPMKLGI